MFRLGQNPSKIWLLQVLYLTLFFSCKEEDSFRGYHIDTRENGAKDITVFDIDNDGDLDVLGVNLYSGGIFIFKM